MDFKTVVKTGKNFASRNLPSILTGLAIGGFIGTIAVAIKDTPKAHVIFEEKLKQYGTVNDIPKKEILTDIVPVYLPTIFLGSASILCIIGSNAVNLKRNAAIMSLYKISDTAYRELRTKVREEIGERKATIIQDKIAKDRIDRNPLSLNEVLMTDISDTLCFDAISGRYFMSDMETIRRTMNDMNTIILAHDYVSLNEFYSALGLPPINIGYEMGWRVDHPIDIEFSSQITDNGRPCLVVDYRVGPHHNFRETHF